MESVADLRAERAASYSTNVRPAQVSETLARSLYVYTVAVGTESAISRGRREIERTDRRRAFSDGRRRRNEKKESFAITGTRRKVL